MCGIAGFFRPAGLGTAAEEILARLAGTLAHRGPDDSGVWCDPPAGIALGHRRLAVLDLSAAGRQPMISVSGRFVIVCPLVVGRPLPTFPRRTAVPELSEL